MIIVRPEDALHKSQLLTLLTEIIDNPKLSSNLYFKGGTCASMLGYLDRFSVDLDFDLKSGSNKKVMRTEFNQVFSKLGLTISNQSKNALEFWLKYPAPANSRNTIKLDALNISFKSNLYESKFLPEIDRLANCQTIETMFANKLVAATDRFQKHGSIAGRDIYDIHHFFTQGYSFRQELISERTGLDQDKYISKLIDFIDTKVTQTIIDEDLNTLLPREKFQQIRKILKPQTLMFLRANLAASH